PGLLYGRKSFFPVSEDLRAQLQPLIDLSFYEPSGIEKVQVISLPHHLITRTAIEQPFPLIFLHPDWQLVPYLANSKAPVKTSRRKLNHREASDLRNVFRFLNERYLRSQLHVR